MGFFSSLFGSEDKQPQSKPRVSNQPVVSGSGAFVTIMATDGPMAPDRERLRELRASGITQPVIHLVECSKIPAEAEELIELVEFEIVELCEESGFPHPPQIVRLA